MIQLDKVSKIFGTGVAGLTDVDLSIEKGDFVFLVGKTGSGKTTLLRLLIRETLPSKGSIILGEWDIVKLPAKKIPNLRKRIGIIFQDLRLLMDRTVFENIVLPLELSGVKKADAKKKVEDLLEQVGILVHRDKFPVQLSGGELQRAAIARALVLSPEIILADEPTGNLDPKTSDEIMTILFEINKKGTTIVMATHNSDIVNKAGRRVVTLEKGKITKDDKKGKYASS